MVSGTAISANSDKGGSANAPAAPEMKAMARLCQPEDKITPSMSEPAPLARGIMAELATLKESPFLIGRIAIADHSPNAGRVRTRAPESPKVKDQLARDSEARVLSVGAQRARATALGEPGQTQLNQTSKRK